MSILPEERKNAILQELDRTGKVKVIDFAEQFQVSQETIRRDLMILEEKGLLKRVYGGAVKKSYQGTEPPFVQRKIVNQEAKIKIGKAAAKLISDGDTIVIDVGTTALELARSIENKKEITILTNSLPVSSVLTDLLNQKMFSGEVLLLGGQLNPKQQSVGGRLTEKMLSQFHIDKAFISAGGVSIDGGVSDYDLTETSVSQEMIHVSKEIILLVDHSKIGVDAFCKICPLEKVDVIVCDQPIPKGWKNHKKTNGINWITAD
ncbi:DeoR/GlpR family DNA-binding transcription regulator [Aeribacillus pallidus]|jgi:DeoR/GlpR family transcriptional regulator of sugar metabolism|uniref:DeoR family transcriptional regulator n=1 Tax=Aeribacillus pallidus TaxID=33936 RepID=A0A165YS63_9BACI|nr:DeoR/GlpR family DNA-binding transcription regulator [Aeribacillus pallidus]KZN97393.1 DeoR family transcriptional regulator [Aeribacillus pallidus]